MISLRVIGAANIVSRAIIGSLFLYQIATNKQIKSRNYSNTQENRFKRSDFAYLYQEGNQKKDEFERELVINERLKKISEEKGYEDLLKEYEKNKHKFTESNIIQCLVLVARKHRHKKNKKNTHDSRLMELCERAEKIMKVSKLSSFSSALWSFATLEISSSKLMHHALNRLQSEHDESLQPKNISNISWSAAKIASISNDPDEKESAAMVVKRMCDIASVKLDQFKPQEVSNLAWSMGKLGIAHQSVLSMIQEYVIQNFHFFKSQEIANILWCFGSLKIQKPHLFKFFSEEALRSRNKGPSSNYLEDFSNQDLSLVCWSFSTLKHQDPPLFAKIASLAMQRLENFSPIGLSMLAYSFSQQNSQTHFLEKTKDHILHNLDKFKPQEIGSLLFSFGNSNIKCEEFTNKIENITLFQNSFKPLELINVAFYLSSFNYRKPQIYEKIEQSLVSLFESDEHDPSLSLLQPVHLSRMAWSFANADRSSSDLFNVITKLSIKRIHEFEPGHFSDIAWSYAKLSISSNLLFKSIKKELLKRDLNTFEPSHLADISWGIGVDGEKSPESAEIMSRISSFSYLNLDRFRPHELSVITWACNTFGIEADFESARIANYSSALM